MDQDNYWTRRMMAGRWSRRRVMATAGVGAVGAGAFALVGCGDDDDDDPTGTATGTATATGTGTASGTGTTTATGTTTTARPKLGGTIATAFDGGPQEMPHLDPALTNTGLLHYYGAGAAYSRLIKFKVGPDVTPGTFILEGDLAEDEWEQPDTSTYIFKIRENAKWQNLAPVNGRAVTAEDVKFSYERQRDLKVNAGQLGSFETIEAMDERTLMVNTRSRCVVFLITFASHLNDVVAREAVEVKGDLKEGPTIGTGPWIMTEWQTGSVVKFRKNPDYYLKDEFGTLLPYADEMVIYRIADFNVAVAQWRGKQTMVIGNAGSPATFELLEGEYESNKASTYRVPTSLAQGGAGTQRVWTHLNDGPTMDPKVRKALSIALDRDSVIDALVDGQGRIVSDVTLPNPDWMLSESELRTAFPFDPGQARSLLQEAGQDGWGPQMSVGTWSFMTALGDLVYAAYADIGMNPSITPCDNICNAEKQTTGNYELHVGGPTRPNTMTSDLLLSYRSNGSLNGPKFNDPDLDRMIDAQTGEFDEAKRRDLATQIQRRVIEIGGYVPVFASNGNRMVVHNQMQGWPVHPSQDHDAYTRCWIA